MITRWLRQTGAEELLLFFNGWGMDGRIGNVLLNASSGETMSRDLLLLYDYRTLDIDTDIASEIERYRRITIIAWSFGVWAAQQALLPPIDEAIAINGTCYPVHSEKGIAPDIFQATLTTYSDKNRHRFNRRMCGTGEALALFDAISPERSTIEQQEELVQLQQHLATSQKTTLWHYSHAIIGGKDQIFLPQQQYHAWKGIPQTIISDMPHFPFLHFTTFEEILACLGR